MAILLPSQIPYMNSAKRQRRSATTVMAGSFDLRPPRDVLTSLLNGVGPYKAVEKDEESRRHRKKEKRERDKERRREKALLKALQLDGSGFNATAESNHASTSSLPPVPAAGNTSSFWHERPAIHIATMQRSVSVTPPPTSPMLLPSTPDSTPGPSISSSTSRTSSKRPHTPDDGEEFDAQHHTVSALSPHPPRKRRVAVKKGWKGWVEGSPPPSEKLINLDAVPVLQERRTRSGKNFDAIGVGKDGWV
ncbi:hypothetical protein L208DRAFT_1434285 [Tricholoma matsutake]|nr:hypothetical protein L208DRAFT_1434285 [Tricholoma matsutake 945]